MGSSVRSATPSRGLASVISSSIRWSRSAIDYRTEILTQYKVKTEQSREQARPEHRQVGLTCREDQVKTKKLLSLNLNLRLSLYLNLF